MAVVCNFLAYGNPPSISGGSNKRLVKIIYKHTSYYTQLEEGFTFNLLKV